MTTLFILEWSAALLTIWGAWLLSGADQRASRGFVLFLAANVVWILYAWLTSQSGLLVQQLALTYTSLRGIWLGLVEPWLDWLFDEPSLF